MAQHFIIIDNASDLTSEALSFLKDLDGRFFPTPWSPESWEKTFFEGASRFIVLLKNDGELVGFTLFDENAADSFAHLLKILIDPKVRTSGFGRALLNEAIEILKRRGVKTFFLEVEEHNDSAIRLYEKVGFKVIHKKKQFYSNGASALIMTLGV